jgi:hypothetical protein
MASFSNLALAGSQLGTKYLNEAFTVTRGGYAQLGALMITVAALTLLLPLGAVAAVRLRGMRTA